MIDLCRKSMGLDYSIHYLPCSSFFIGPHGLSFLFVVDLLGSRLAYICLGVSKFQKFHIRWMDPTNFLQGILVMILGPHFLKLFQIDLRIR